MHLLDEKGERIPETLKGFTDLKDGQMYKLKMEEDPLEVSDIIKNMFQIQNIQEIYRTQGFFDSFYSAILILFFFLKSNMLFSPRENVLEFIKFYVKVFIL